MASPLIPVLSVAMSSDARSSDAPPSDTPWFVGWRFGGSRSGGLRSEASWPTSLGPDSLGPASFEPVSSTPGGVAALAWAEARSEEDGAQAAASAWRGFRLARLGLPLLLALGSALCDPARASSPQAWQIYGAEVVKACTAASSLRDVRPAGERLDLHQDSGALTSALLLVGTYRQPHMAGRSGLELCLYDSRTRQARVAEADRLDQRSR